MFIPVITGVLVAIITLLAWICTKLLAVLVGALLLYFCPIIFLMFAAGTAVVIYRKRIMRKVIASRRVR